MKFSYWAHYAESDLEPSLVVQLVLVAEILALVVPLFPFSRS